MTKTYTDINYIEFYLISFFTLHLARSSQDLGYE